MSTAETLVRRLVMHGVLCTALGVAVESLVGGIHKDPSNYSYYFTTLGISMTLLAGFVLVVDIARIVRPLRLVADVGANPMLGYLAIRNVLAPVWALAGIGTALSSILSTPWLGALHALLKTWALAAFTAVCTRLRVVWRS